MLIQTPAERAALAARLKFWRQWMPRHAIDATPVTIDAHAAAAGRNMIETVLDMLADARTQTGSERLERLLTFEGAPSSTAEELLREVLAMLTPRAPR